MALKGNKYGTHRVIEPKGVLTQAAYKIDNNMDVLYSNEIICDVQSLNIDSASFTQIEEACGGDEKKIGEMIMGIVAERGKQLVGLRHDDRVLRRCGRLRRHVRSGIRRGRRRRRLGRRRFRLFCRLGQICQHRVPRRRLGRLLPEKIHAQRRHHDRSQTAADKYRQPQPLSL